MSSHHFVKEGQEPALIIEDVAHITHLQAILEWSPQVIVLESAVAQVRLLGIKADVVFAEPGAIKNVADDLAYQMPLDILSAPKEQMLARAFELLIQRGQHHVFVSVKLLRDHFTLSDPYLKTLEITFLDENTKWSSVSSGKIAKWWPSGSSLSIVAPSGFTLAGLAEKTSEKCIRLKSDSLVSIHSEGIFWIGEPLE